MGNVTKPCEFDYHVLSGKIVERCGTRLSFARAIGLSPSALSQRMNNKTDWSSAEILRACNILGIGAEDVGMYFFCPKT